MASASNLATTTTFPGSVNDRCRIDNCQERAQEYYRALNELSFYIRHYFYQSNNLATDQTVFDVIRLLRIAGYSPLQIGWDTIEAGLAGDYYVKVYSDFDQEVEYIDPLLSQVSQAIFSICHFILKEELPATGAKAQFTMEFLEENLNKRKSKQKGRGNAKRAKYSVYDDPEAFMTDPKSPIFEQWCNIKDLLQHPRAREILLAKGIDPDFVEQPGFATSAARYQEDGRAGRYDEEWRREAKAASERRAAGDFDEYLEDKFKKEWGSDDSEIVTTRDGLTTDAHLADEGEKECGCDDNKLVISRNGLAADANLADEKGEESSHSNLESRPASRPHTGANGGCFQF